MKFLTWTIGAFLLFSVAMSATHAAQIAIFERENFRGQRLDLDTSAPNFERLGINDRASSVRVRGGAWQVCSDNFFRGTCVTLQPGDYPSLRQMGLSNAISSAREVAWAANRNWSERRWPDDRGDQGHMEPRREGREYDRGQPAQSAQQGWGTASRAILYSGQNLSGRAIILDDEVVPDLGPSGFNDRAMSLRVEGGYWVFCSDANFEGTCRTFAPGDYPTLSGLSDAISSGRRISDTYPYSHRPRW